MRWIYLISVCLLLSACVTDRRAQKQVSTLVVTESQNTTSNNTVVLLHGLARTDESMEPMARALNKVGYRVCNIDYPSRYFDVSTLAQKHVWLRIQECVTDAKKVDGSQIHFVTHSMGGIMVRALNDEIATLPVGRLVMLSPPSKGSDLVDKLKGFWPMEAVAGPGGRSLGTGTDDVPSQLPIPSMPFGIIAAKQSNSPLSFIIPGDDDGVVSLEKMRLDGMTDYVEVSSTHSLMMQNWQVIEQTLYFLSYEKFYKKP